MLDDFFVRALAAGIGVALVTGPLGCFVVWRRMAYFGATLSHSALLGIALALLLGFDPVIGIIVQSLIVVPALILLVFWRRWRQVYPNSTIWLWMAFAAILCLPLLSLASTATDRIALYLTPLQVVVLSRLPFLAGKRETANVLMTGILFGYGAVLYVWLNYATHSFCWVPYDNLLF